MSNSLLSLIREARAKLSYDSPLEPNNPQWVNLSQVRGDFSESRLLTKLGIFDDADLDPNQESVYLAFGGHRGCGKSTELRLLEQKLQRQDRYCVVFIDVLSELDVNNLRYSDILLAQAKALFDKLTAEGITLEQVFVTRLQNWFEERIEKHEQTRELATELKAGAEINTGLPLLGKLFAALTNSVRFNSTYKTEIRNSVRNHFSEFAEAFNLLLQHAEQKLREANCGQKILFIVDGTDRLRGEDADDFFVRDVYQLKLIRASFIYCAPIHLLSENGSLQQSFEIARLPMIKLNEKHEQDLLSAPLAALRELVYRRVDPALFDDEITLDYLIRYSGGHLRDLIRLLRYSLEETLGQQPIDQNCAQRAVNALATEYRRLINQEDFALLAEIDQHAKDHVPNSEQTRRLLYDLVLLEYNGYWWRTHPAVTTLSAYQTALTKA